MGSDPHALSLSQCHRAPDGLRITRVHAAGYIGRSHVLEETLVRPRALAEIRIEINHGGGDPRGSACLSRNGRVAGPANQARLNLPPSGAAVGRMSREAIRTRRRVAAQIRTA